MNWDRIEGNWKQLSGKVRQQWGKLTDDDLDLIDGRREELAGRIQEVYGISKDEAEQADRALQRLRSTPARIDMGGSALAHEPGGRTSRDTYSHAATDRSRDWAAFSVPGEGDRPTETHEHTYEIQAAAARLRIRRARTGVFRRAPRAALRRPPPSIRGRRQSHASRGSPKCAGKATSPASTS